MNTAVARSSSFHRLESTRRAPARRAMRRRAGPMTPRNSRQRRPSLIRTRMAIFQYALVYAGMNHNDRTIDQVEQRAGVGPVRIGFPLPQPEFALVRAESRVKVPRKKVGLPEGFLR